MNRSVLTFTTAVLLCTSCTPSTQAPEEKQPVKTSDPQKHPEKSNAKVSREEAEKLFISAYVKYLENDFEGSNQDYKKVVDGYAEEPIGYIAAYNMACNFGRLDEPEKAFRLLHMAVSHGYPNLKHIDSDQDLADVREMKGYEEMMDRAEKVLEEKKPKPAIKKEDVPAFARKLIKAKKEEETNTLTALFSRMGWFYDEKLPERLNAILKKEGYLLENEGGRWGIRSLEEEEDD